MKKTLANVFSGVALLSMTGALYLGSSNSAEAGLIAWDDFNSYTAGAKAAGLNGGHGWSGSWATGFVNNDNATISDISINFSAGGITRGGGNSMRISGTQDNALSRQLFAQKDTSGQDYFLSFAFEVRNANGTGGNSTEAFGSWAATDGRGPNSVQAMTVGGVMGQTGLARVGRDNNDKQGRTANTIVYNETYFMVVGYSGWDGLTYTTSTVWLYDSNQTVISEATGLIATSHVEGAGSQGILGLQLRTHYLSNGTGDLNKVIYFDDIRFGDSWDSVVTGAIPEASTTALIVGGIASLAVIGLRRRKQNRVTES